MTKKIISLMLLVLSFLFFPSALLAYHEEQETIQENAPSEEEFIELIGTIKSLRLGKRAAFYLHTEDEKRYHLLSRALWQKVVLYTHGIFKNKSVRVMGKPVKNRFGKVFGISYTSIEPVQGELDIPQEIPHEVIAEDFITKGIIKARKFGKRIGFYLFSEDDGRKYLLLNKPDWKKAMHYLLSKERVIVHGKPWFNSNGKLIGIRFTDIIPFP